MNQSIARFFIEIFFVASFAVAVAFLINVYSSSGAIVKNTSEWARQGNNVQESFSAKADEAINELVDNGNTIDGSSIYYDIVGSSQDVADGSMTIYIDSAKVDYAAILKAVEGDPNELMSLIDTDASYVKTYAVDHDKLVVVFVKN